MLSEHLESLYIVKFSRVSPFGQVLTPFQKSWLRSCYIEGITGIPSTQGAQNILLMLVIALYDRLDCIVLKHVVVLVAKIQSCRKSRKSQKLEYGALMTYRLSEFSSTKRVVRLI